MRDAEAGISYHRCCRGWPGRLATASVESVSRGSPGCRRSPRGRAVVGRGSRYARSPSSRCSRCPGCCVWGSLPPLPPGGQSGSSVQHMLEASDMDSWKNILTEKKRIERLMPMPSMTSCRADTQNCIGKKEKWSKQTFYESYWLESHTK